MLPAKKQSPNNLKAIKPDSITAARPEKSLSVIIPSEKYVHDRMNIKKAALIKKLDAASKLTIAGPDDKEGFLLLQETRKNLKVLRVMVENICMAARQPAIKVQDEWVELEKALKKLIEPVEKDLYEKEKQWLLDKKAEETRKKLEQDKAFLERSAVLTGFGAVIEKGFLVLKDISYDIVLIREMDNETYEELILPKYKNIFEEAERQKIAEQEVLIKARELKGRVYKMRLKELNEPVFTHDAVRIQSHDYQKDKLVDLPDEQWEILRDAHNLEVAQAKEAALKEQARVIRVRTRSMILTETGFHLYHDGAMKYGEEIITKETMTILEDPEWQLKLAELKNIVETDRKERLRITAEKNKKIATGMSRSQLLINYGEKRSAEVLSELDEEAWQVLLTEKKTTYETKVAAEQATAKAEILAASDDATKWNHFIEELKAIQVPQLKSKKFREISLIIADKIKAILDVIIKYKP